MKVQVLCALVVLVLAPSALANCNSDAVVPVPLSQLFNRWYSVYLMSGQDDSTGCLYTEIIGNDDGTARLNTYTIVNNVLASVHTSKLTEIKEGLYLREFDDGTVRTHITTSLTELMYGEFKMSFVLCEEGNPIPKRYGFVSNMFYGSPDFTDDLKKVEESFGKKNLLLIPNMCNPYDYLTIIDKSSKK